MNLSFTLLSGLSEIPTTITKPLQECVTIEGDTVTLEAEVSKPSIKGEWYKDDREIAPDEKFEIKVEDTLQSLTIHDLTLEDEGEYTIEVPGDSSTAMVWVEGKSSDSSLQVNDRHITLELSNWAFSLVLYNLYLLCSVPLICYVKYNQTALNSSDFIPYVNLKWNCHQPSLIVSLYLHGL